MDIIYLIIIIAGVSGQNIAKKFYTEKTGTNGTYLYSSLTALFSMLFFLLTSKNISWNSEVVPYSIAFALSFATSSLFGLLAVASGPLSLSSLMISYSLMIPTFYGIIFLKEPISICFVIGLAMLAISLFLVNKKNDKCPVTPKWLLFVFLSFAGNGLCSTVQKMQQIKFDGEYKNEFMIISLAIVFLIFAVATLVTNKDNFKSNFYHARFIAVSAGAMNGIVNLLVMVLSGTMAVSVMFPLISAGGIIVTYVVSKVFYKEKLTKIQFAGFLTGLASIVFLNI
jgi:drug/metabolite transporter (DMT)-like permease